MDLISTHGSLRGTERGTLICDEMILPRILMIVGQDVKQSFYTTKEASLTAMIRVISGRIGHLRRVPLATEPLLVKQEVKSKHHSSGVRAVCKEAVAVVPGCEFCGKNHPANQWNTFNTFEKKVEQAKKLKLCFKCLKAGHFSQRCEFKGTCHRCGGGHRTKLCRSDQNTGRHYLK
jgi:hypothetical protein